MTELSPEQLKVIKEVCAEAGCEFVGLKDGKVLVKSIEPLPPDPISIKETFEAVMSEFEFNGRHSEKTSGRKRYGKRPKFHD